MTTTVGFDTRSRAISLWTLAGKWDRTIFAADDLDVPTERTISELTRTAAEYAHPLLSLTDIQALMETLRDALGAKDAYENNGISPIDDEDIAGYSPAMITALLDHDIDDALWPLLTGLSTAHACLRCRNRSANVWSWHPRLPGKSACEAHA